MSRTKGTKSRRGALGVALASALTFLNRPQEPWQVYALSALLFCSLFYWLSGWITKPGLSVAERIGRTATLLLILAIVVGWYAWLFRPGWHLNGEQEDVLKEVAHRTPKNIAILVELFENSPAGQEYGHDIMDVLKENGASVNSITVFRGVDPTPVGIIVCAPHRGDPGYDAAGLMHWKMLTVHMPANLKEDCANVDRSAFIIYVGSRPVE